MTAKPPAPTSSPLVGDGLKLLAEISSIEAEKAAVQQRLAEKNKELAAIAEQLVDQGPGRYQDEAGRVAIVVSGTGATMAPDTFTLRSAEDEEKLRKVAGPNFRKLCDRVEYYVPKGGFAAIAEAVLTPAKARDAIALCLIPGQLQGGRASHVRWPKLLPDPVPASAA